VISPAAGLMGMASEGFKRVNDRYGRDSVDNLLNQVGKLQAAVACGHILLLWSGGIRGSQPEIEAGPGFFFDSVISCRTVISRFSALSSFNV